MFKVAATLRGSRWESHAWGQKNGDRVLPSIVTACKYGPTQRWPNHHRWTIMPGGQGADAGVQVLFSLHEFGFTGFGICLAGHRAVAWVAFSCASSCRSRESEMSIIIIHRHCRVTGPARPGPAPLFKADWKNLFVFVKKPGRVGHEELDG